MWAIQSPLNDVRDATLCIPDLGTAPQALVDPFDAVGAPVL